MGEVLRVPVYNNKQLFSWALVDAEDYPRVVPWLWRRSGKEGHYYVVRWADGHRAIYMHRMIMGLDPGDARMVDHKNGNSFDNTRTNLRVCTHAQNMQNTRKRQGTTSRFQGVTRSRNGQRWVAQAGWNGERYYLGTYDTEAEAGAISAAFRTEHFTHYEQRSV